MRDFPYGLRVSESLDQARRNGTFIRAATPSGKTLCLSGDSITISGAWVEYKWEYVSNDLKIRIDSTKEVFVIALESKPKLSGYDALSFGRTSGYGLINGNVIYFNKYALASDLVLRGDDVCNRLFFTFR